MTEAETRQELVRLSRSLFERGFSVGSAGNISVAVEGGYLVTPTNSCLGFLTAERISKLDGEWRHTDGDPPSKEVFMHRAFYETRKHTGAVVHLHSTCATGLSCLADLDPQNCLQPLTPYAIMRVGRVALLPYLPPGDAGLGALIRDLGGDCAAVLLANHGPVVSGRDLISAVYAAEEFEEAAKLQIMLAGNRKRMLGEDDIAELQRRFGA